MDVYLEMEVAVRTKAESESSVEGYLRDEVALLGGQAWKWVSPGTRGVPDRILLLPGGRVVFVELKKEFTGRPSEIQKYRIKQLQELGHDIRLIYGKSDVRDLIQELKHEIHTA